MSDTTNTTPAALPSDTLDTLLAAIEKYGARLEGGLAKDLSALDVWLAQEYAEYAPYIKAFFVLFFQQETKVAVAVGIAAAPTANPADILAAVGTAVVGSAGAYAAADAETEIKDAESAEGTGGTTD